MPVSKSVRVDWDLDELLDVFAHLNQKNLVWFLQPLFPKENLEGWKEEELLELGLGMIQQWERKCSASPDGAGQFLISVAENLCRSSFEAFVRFFWDEVPGSQRMLWGWFMNVYCDELQFVANQIFQYKPRPHDLICNVPPGQSKSSIWSVLFPCWVWTRMPKAALITASHTDSLVTDLASKSRDVMYGNRYRALFPEIQFSESLDSKGHYRNTLGGERFTCTVAGKSPTGKHCHFALVDDPIDPKKVLSEAERKTAADFMTKVMPSRRMRGAEGDVSTMFLIMQRLGVDDPTDVMLNIAKQRGAWPVRHICLPAELTDDVSPLELRANYLKFNEWAGKNPEGLLDPIRLTRLALDEQRAILGEWAYAGQFLQKPRPIAGGMFKVQWFNRRCRAAPFNARRLRYWDRACLIAGTKIETSVGLKPIEDMKEGDLVLTRKGYRRVVWAGETKRTKELCRLITPDGLTLTATPDHRIWSDSRNEWVPISELTDTDILLRSGDALWQTEQTQTPKQLSSMECGMSRKKMEGDIIGPICGTKKGRNIILNPCIEPCGNSTMVQFRTARKSTTRMKIRKTTTSPISSVFQEKNTEGDTQERRCGGLQSRWQGRSKDCGDGGRMVLLLDKRKGQRNWYVKHVGKNIFTRRKNLGLLDTVATNVGTTQRRRGEERREFVWAVRKNSYGQGKILTTVRMNAEVPVYDLEVEDQHEFFANGILVHNSSAETSACATAGVLMAYDGEKIYVEDVVYGRWEPDERNAEMLATAQRDRTKYGRYEPTIYVEAEGGSSGRDAWLGVVRALIGFPVREDRVQGSKDARAEPWSCQLAAGNVWLVDNGASEANSNARCGWDIEGYVQDHLNFRPTPGSKLGRQKDRIDASSGAFNLLVGVKRAYPALRTFALKYKKGGDLRYIVVCKKGELPLLEIDNKPSLILSLQDPPLDLEERKEQMKRKVISQILEALSPPSSPPTPACESPIIGEVSGGVQEGEDFLHHLPKNYGNLSVAFADLDPADYVGPEYEKPIAPWDVPIQKLQLSREQGQKIWSFLFKKYDEPWGVLVLVDQDDNVDRALSVAYGVADGLRLPRSVIHIFGEDGVVCTKEDSPPNNWIWGQVKASKTLVVEP